MNVGQARVSGHTRTTRRRSATTTGNRTRANPNLAATSYAYTGPGQLWTPTDGHGTTTWAYDDLWRNGRTDTMKIVQKANGKITLSVDQEELRVIHGSFRESLEVIHHYAFESRMGVSTAEVRRLRDEFDLVYRRRGRRKKISVTDHELTAIRNAIRAALEIEDWEFHPRMGFTKAEVRSFLAEVCRFVSA